ncbi:MAG: hypothetical protein LBD29_04930 [Treponema sp.]|jgi:hypothetical protein|nr:hypothetical protein [Treponema sp.]
MDTKEQEIISTNENGVVVNVIGTGFNTRIEVFYHENLVYTMSNAREEFIVLRELKYLSPDEKKKYYDGFFDCIRGFYQRFFSGTEKGDCRHSKTYAPKDTGFTPLKLKLMAVLEPRGN